MRVSSSWCIRSNCDILETHAVSVVELDGVTDDFAWIAVPVIEGSGGFHDASLAVMVSN